MASRTTSDFVWEDPLEKIEGVEDVTMFFGLIKYFGAVEFKTFQEVHSAHEIIMDWELTVGFISLHCTLVQIGLILFINTILIRNVLKCAKRVIEKVFKVPV